MPLDTYAQKRLALWTGDCVDPHTKEAVETIAQRASESEISSLFAQTLRFGTGGLRATVGVGPARINSYTVAAVAKAIAAHLKEKGFKKEVLIGYDCRVHSWEFAQVVAAALEQKQIACSFFAKPLSTPLLAFSARHYGCWAVMITASHNPAHHNGIKIYDDSGSQVRSPHDKEIMQKVNFDDLQLPTVCHISTISQKQKRKTLHFEPDELYLAALTAAHTRLHPKVNVEKLAVEPLKILFSNLHGTGERLMEKALQCSHQSSHFSFRYVQEQKKQDGTFPTVSSPNPEKLDTLRIGIEQMEKEGSDLLLATDPDGDRLAVVCRSTKNGAICHLNGHQVAALLAAFQIKKIKEQAQKNKEGLTKPVILKSVVTSSLLEAIANEEGAHCYSTPTGSKWLAEGADLYHEHLAIAAEESGGFLLYPFMREKDAHQAALVLCELAFSLKQEGKTLYDALYALYAKHGLYYERVEEIPLEGHESLSQQQVANIGEKLLDLIIARPPSLLDDQRLETLKDGRVFPYLGMSAPAKIVLLQSKSYKVFVRSSGTEAKIKLYFQAHFFPSRNYCEIDSHCLKKMQSLRSQVLPSQKDLDSFSFT